MARRRATFVADVVTASISEVPLDVVLICPAVSSPETVKLPKVPVFDVTLFANVRLP